ncbi:beta-L-arabinofuranosidase domain-containing protein [Microlunatus soli]|uniref:Beta-L-arabinofuranosidase, GH127 n=1 Tax=Microlunatus soli TaxID=630515 RepID=A0A1H1Q6Q8_9ACTN|nr:beta-L-arabinofuranosidase domain-containing protein [Microlunatus soli]SDS19080.1 Beta-L-arabinofuranosidase, GH127 [Microlunatus soli]
MTSSNRPRQAELPLGAIRPEGWLHDQLRLQADGLTGRLPEVWPDVGPDSGWLGGTGESWERGPYYLDGLLPLAYVLDDQDLIDQVRPWVEWMIGSQRADGWFGPAGNDDWWPRMVACKVLCQHHDATGDDRVPELLSRYFRYQLDNLVQRPLSGWGRVRGADNVLSVLWLHRLTGDDWLLELADLLLAQTEDWGRYLTEDLVTGRALFFDHRTHGVNVAMGLKTEAVRFLRTGDDLARQRTRDGLAALERWHGLAHGCFSGDEFLGGREPTAGVETCLVVELMYTYQQLARIFGDGEWADRLETIAYNLLPASCDPRMLAHQYHQQANQVRVSVGSRPWTYSSDDANLFGLEPHFGCCTANLHQGWPKLVRTLWMHTLDTDGAPDGLTAVSYAACSIRVTITGAEVRLRVRGDYPFDSVITIEVECDRPASFPIRLRIPGWCNDPRVTVAGEVEQAEIVDDHLVITRQWAGGETIQLELPTKPQLERREKQAVAVRYGPLIMVAGVAENWIPVPGAPGFGEWEVHPRSSWNHGIVADDHENWVIDKRPISAVPFAAEDAPIRIRVPGARIPGWGLDGEQAAPLPEGPVLGSPVGHEVTLTPYGSARLRVTELPTVAAPHPGA